MDIAAPGILATIDLASASPRRRELLSSLGLEVRVVTSTYDEQPLPLEPSRLARTHAAGKNRFALPGADASVVLSADTVVDVDGTALGKPLDRVEAAAMLRRLSGRTHRVHTAFVIRDLARETSFQDCITTAVTFAALDERTIEDYAASGDGLDKAGAYAIQGFGATLVERIDGDYFTVVGLPLAALRRGLDTLGWRIAAPNLAAVS